eukprot:TRINITY_DN21102_c0_g2_i2.p1 TRINITY_DN21102_c0_g2~~TRINITY_DN21102_c0_g2_i2.p1  ORF type:complete len:332 (-),score=69.35 TRINITY_DN21102_c0_g2_i2:115-1110(-)
MARQATAHVVDTVQLCQAAVAELFREKEVAVDIEGVELGRRGEICLIQITGASSDIVYLFDIFVLRDKTFGEGGLKKLLETEEVAKLFFDVRADCDALHHIFGVNVCAAYDVQVLWHVRFQHPDDVYLQGLKKVQTKFLEQSKVLTPRSMRKIDSIKDAGQKMFVPELGGSYEVWKQRPFPPELLEYAAADVKFLLDMRSLWADDCVDESSRLDSTVKEISAKRLSEFVALPDGQALDFSQLKFRDFTIPHGFNTTGEMSEKVSVPPDKRGLVFGKRGATRQEIEAITGARVSLNDATSYALVIGQPEQVRKAVDRIEAIVNRSQLRRGYR